MRTYANFLTFEDFTVGAELGQHDITLDSDMLAAWEKIFSDGQPGGTVPPGIVAIISMRSYATVVAPRPPGNLHGTQSYQITRLPALNEIVTTRLSVTGKEQKGARRWVAFRTETRDASGAFCFSGLTTIVWAA